LRFTTLALRALRPRATRYDVAETGVSPDRRGLVLRVEPSGTKRFLVRYRLAGRATRLTLGTFGDGPQEINEAEARRRLDRAHEFIARGERPPPFVVPPVVVQHRLKKRRRRPPSPLFTRLPDGSPPPPPADVYSVDLLAYSFYWDFCVRKRRRPEYVARILDAEVLPVLGGRDARSVTASHIYEMLAAIARRAPVMSNRVAAVVAQMFKFAIQRGTRSDTPVQLLGPPGGDETSSDRVLTDDELRTVWQRIPTMKASAGIQAALRVLILTGVRRGELSAARRADVDLDRAQWLIPAAVHKNGLDFLTPLSAAAVAELKALYALHPDSEYVLPAPGGRQPVSKSAVTRAVGRNQKHFGLPSWSPHDLRRTLRTGLGNLGVADDLAERVIGHAVGTAVARTYNRAAYLEERRAALELWAQHVAKVVA
jgi:integrase